MSDPDVEASAISSDELYRKVAAGERVMLLDLRDRDEFEAWRITGENVEATQIPHVKFIQAQVTDTVTDLVAEAGIDLDEPIVAVCPRGEASAHVAELLRSAGVDAVNLDDGMDGWARVFVSHELPTDGAVTVRQYYRPSSGCLSYLLYAGGEAVVIDPLWAFADRYIEDAGELGVDLVYAIDTHVHADHLSGVRAVADRSGAEPVVPDGALDRGLAYEATTVTDGDRLSIGEAAIEAIHTPGHTTEMTSFRADAVLFTGDGLFLESVARPDLERGAEGAVELADALFDSLHERLLVMPDDTRVAPGHVGPTAHPAGDGTYSATIGELRELDILGVDRDVFVERVSGDLPPRPANFETIIEANIGTQQVTEDEAFELELGPNNCAVSA